MIRCETGGMQKDALKVPPAPNMWLSFLLCVLGWWHCQAVQLPWRGLAVFLFWHCMPELPQV